MRLPWVRAWMLFVSGGGFRERQPFSTRPPSWKRGQSVDRVIHSDGTDVLRTEGEEKKMANSSELAIRLVLRGRLVSQIPQADCAIVTAGRQHGIVR
jgi:hypothetical protein